MQDKSALPADPAPETDAEGDSLERSLKLPQSITVVTGGIIGVSIFLVPASVANTAGHPILALSVWIIAGILSACAALTYAELGAAMPQTGGIYVFLKKGYGRIFGFFYGWMVMCGYGAAALAIVAIMASGYALRILPSDFAGQASGTLVAIGFIVISGAANLLGIAKSGNLQFVLTVVKVGLILILIALPLGAGHLDLAVFGMAPNPALDAPGIAKALSEGLLLTLFSYSGAHFATQIAGEIKNPARNIPRAIFYGFGIVLGLYLMLNTTIITTLPFETFRYSDAVAVDLMELALGPIGAYFVAISIMISALAVLNAQLMSYPRVVFALARDRLMPQWIADIHPVTHAPWVAVVAVALISVLYILSGSYQTILAAVAFISHSFTTLAVAAVFVFRRKYPDMPRPYKVTFYPYAPAAFILFSIVYLGMLLVTRTWESIAGIAIVASGLPVYLFMRPKAKAQEAELAAAE
ncbi:MAG: hypothetical protein CMK07_17025 [Ponticaulis sp.]|nr:hypothetical protein [Ponticaulis sp.]